ncbi:sensor histidine kinase [Saccharothrix variisporea]|uniref:sensor histidine kinase n=1 Tax=Saccharothrix variisporea TaxID=543527 RepID=UPI001B874516|nr:histidine kinase [Saccharothrix variisporea]
MIAAPADALSNPRMRRARLFTIVGIAGGVAVCLVLAGVGLREEPNALRNALGALGLLTFVAALGGALYRSVTPNLPKTTGTKLLIAFGAAAVLSVPLVAPVGVPHWHTWTFVGASIIGVAPLLLRPWAAAALMAGAVAVSAGSAWLFGGDVPSQVGVTVALGLSVAAWNALHLWGWTFLVQAQEGRDALTRLAATEERLRFARDVHDLLGHNLSVIALKAELASRLALVDGERASQEADEVRALAAAALTEMREVVHGYRRVDLRDQVLAVAQVLRSSGVRCTVTQPDEDLPPALAAPLVSVLREAGTNVMRHSKADWCTIEVVREDAGARLTVVNDGAGDAGPDERSSGLRGLADRLGDVGGTLRTWREDGMFTLEAIVRADT